MDAAIGTTVTVEGVVVQDPDVRERSQFVTLDVGQQYDVLVQTDILQTFVYGDRLQVTGKIEKPEPFNTDTGKIFNYPKYLLAHGVTHVIAFPEVTIVGHGEGNIAVATLLSLKHLLTGGIDASVPEPESALLGGLLLGDKRGLGDTLTDLFRRAGVIHMIVLSGYNVSVVINALLFVGLAFLSRRAAITLALTGVVAFAVMTGASETTIRASLMAAITLLAMALHRPSAAFTALCIASAAMALYNPHLVLYDLSFQLSVLSTLGLILFSARIMPYITWMPEYFGLRETLATTLATQLTVLPLLIYSVGQVSLVSIITNLAVLWAVPYAMLFGFAAALIALLSPLLAFPFSTVAYALLAYIIHVSAWLGALPFAAIQW